MRVYQLCLIASLLLLGSVVASQYDSYDETDISEYESMNEYDDEGSFMELTEEMLPSSEGGGRSTQTPPKVPIKNPPIKTGYNNTGRPIVISKGTFPQFYQCDSAWGVQNIGNTTNSICKKGSTLTVLSVVISGLTGKVTNPLLLNKWVKDNNAVKADGSVDVQAIAKGFKIHLGGRWAAINSTNNAKFDEAVKTKGQAVTARYIKDDGKKTSKCIVTGVLGNGDYKIQSISEAADTTVNVKRIVSARVWKVGASGDKKSKKDKKASKKDKKDKKDKTTPATPATPTTPSSGDKPEKKTKKDKKSKKDKKPKDSTKPAEPKKEKKDKKAKKPKKEKKPKAPKASTGSFPTYKQCDKKWGGIGLGTSSSSLCKSGCAISSLAMAATRYSGQSVTPATMNSWLKAHGGYVSGNLLVWGAVNNSPWKTRLISTSAQSVTSLKAAVAAGRAPVVCVNGCGHWILVTGYAGGSTFKVHDPYFSRSTYTFSQFSGRFNIYGKK